VHGLCALFTFSLLKECTDSPCSDSDKEKMPHVIRYRDRVLLEQVAVLCALLGILTLSCKLRLVSAIASLVGIVALFLYSFTGREIECSTCRWHYKGKPIRMESLEPDTELEMEKDEELPTEQPEPVPVDQKQPEVEVKQPHINELPPPEPVMDDEAYSLGLVISNHSSGSSYARYVRPKINPPGMDAATEVRGRNRLNRPAPVSFTNGGYRSNTGQMSSFAFN
jgi:hypothetical protein